MMPPRLRPFAPALLTLFGVLGTCEASGADPRSLADLRQVVAEAVARGANRVVVPPGVYRGEPPRGEKVHLDLNGLSDLEIVADQVTLTCTRRTRAIAFTACRNVTLRGLTIDYDPLTFTQGRVIATADDGAWIDVKLDAGYPRQPWPRIDVIDPATRYRRKGMPFLWGTTAEMVQPDVVRVRLPGIGKAAPAGMLASLSAGCAPDGICHAMTLERCGGGMVLRDVTLHAAPGMGIVEFGGDGGTVLAGVRIVAGPPPRGATEPRLLTTSWDGIQHSTTGRGPRVEHCIIEHCGDDSWSVQSVDYRVLASQGGRYVLGTRCYAMLLRPGDRLRGSNDSPEWTIRTVEPIPLAQAGLPEEVASRLRPGGAWRPWELGQFARVTLDRDDDWPVGQSLYCPQRQCNGFVFRNNRLHSSGRVLIEASDGLIENNRLFMPHAITLSPSLPAGGAAGIHDVVIRGNTIVESGYFCPAPWSSEAGAISISHGDGNGKLRPPGTFERIVVEDNTLTGVNGVNLVITSARGVMVRGNRFLEPHRIAPGNTGASYGVPQSSVVWIAESQGVELRQNEVRGRGPFGQALVTVDPTSTAVTGAAW